MFTPCILPGVCINKWFGKSAVGHFYHCHNLVLLGKAAQRQISGQAKEKTFFLVNWWNSLLQDEAMAADSVQVGPIHWEGGEEMTPHVTSWGMCSKAVNGMATFAGG